MKRRTSIKIILTLLLALTLVLSSLLLASCADEPTETVTVTYEERDYGILITGYRGVLSENAELKIPSVINSVDVVAIADDAFAGKTDLRSIILPSGVLAIGERAFKNCKNLEYVNIPTGVAELKSEVFSGCESLKEIDLPEAVTKIAEDAFEDCGGVEHLTAHGWALSYFDLTSLKTLNVRGTLEVGAGMFSDCKRLESITLPFVGSDENATANTHFGYIFGAESAADNGKALPSTLKKVVITGGKVVDDNAFSGCTSLTTVILPKGLETIGVSAFEDCTSLSRADIPASVKYIGNGAFASTAIESAKIPASITKVGARTFADCANLKSITLGRGVEELESGAFDGCLGLEELHVDSTEQWLSFDFDSCFDSPLYYAGTLFIGKDEAKSVVIPKSVTKIGKNAFYRCTSIESVILHDGVHAIEDYAFAGCSSLSGVEFPESVKSIGTAAFSGCSSIKSLTLPEGITEIGNHAFNLCTSLTSLEFCANVSKIGEAVFRATAISSLSVSENVSEIDPTAFADTSKIRAASAPACVFAAIETGALESAEIISGETVQDTLFKDAARLKSVAIAASVSRIGNGAFSGCTSLLSVDFADGSLLATIGNGAFQGCNRLTSFVLCEGVETIGEGAFQGCLRLAEVYDLSDKIELSPFSEDNGKLCANAYHVHTSRETPSLITSVGDYKFITHQGAVYLIGYFGENTVLTLPERVGDESYSVGLNAFANSDILSITIPKTVMGLDSTAFTGTHTIEELEISTDLLMLFDNDAKERVRALIINGGTRLDASSTFGFKALKTVNIGESLSEIDSIALVMLTELASISVDAANTSLKSIDGHLYKITDGGDVLLKACPATTDYFTLPTTVIEIGDGAFAGCKLLTNLYIEEGSVLRRIGELAFADCEILYSLELPSSVSEIGQNAFLGCSYLSELEFSGKCQRYATAGGCLIDKTNKTVILCFGEDGVVTIPADGSVTKVVSLAASKQKTITKLVLAKGVEYEELAFVGLSALETIETAKNDSRYNVIDGCLIKVATGELILATNTAKIPTGGAVTSISQSAFAGNDALTAIIIPDSVTYVAPNAFSGCENLTKVTTPVAFLGEFDATTVTSLTISGKGTLTLDMLEPFTALESLTVASGVKVSDGETSYTYSAIEPTEEGSFYYIDGGKIKIW